MVLMDMFNITIRRVRDARGSGRLDMSNRQMERNVTARDFETPAYQRIASEWAERVDLGELKDGDRLPTRSEMEDQYGVSRQVVRDALALLHQEGYVRSAPGPHGGTYVTRPAMLTLPMYVLEADDRARDAFVAAVEDQGHRARQDIRIETAAPAVDIAKALELSADSLVTIRRRVRFVDDIPYAIADSYFPHEFVAGTPIAQPADIPTGGRHVMRELGLAMTDHKDVISSRRPHRNEMQVLRLAPGLAVTVHDRTSRTSDGVAVRHMRSILPSDRWTVTYEVRA
jgi:GntR family transcriptional regulator